MNFIDAVIESIRQTLTSAGFWHGVVVSVAVAFLTLLGKWLLHTAKAFLHGQIEFSAAGYWIGECLLPSYQGKPNLEIWFYSQRGENITFKFFAYSPNHCTAPTKWVGEGLYRGGKLSAFYYKFKKRTYEAGVLALELKGLRLKGIYAQFDPNVPDEPLYISDNNYVQWPLQQLSLRSKLKMIVGQQPFRGYEEVQELYKEVTTPRPGS